MVQALAAAASSSASPICPGVSVAGFIEPLLSRLVQDWGSLAAARTPNESGRWQRTRRAIARRLYGMSVFAWDSRLAC